MHKIQKEQDFFFCKTQALKSYAVSINPKNAFLNIYFTLYLSIIKVSWYVLVRPQL